MPDQPFFFVNNEPISQVQVCNYLKSAGQLDDFIETILSQHVIAQHLQTHPELLPTEEIREQLLKNFRQTQKLSDSTVFEVWLQQNNLELGSLSDRLQQQWSMQQLMKLVSQPRLHEYFIRRKLQLDQVYLACIIVQDETLANEFYDQVKEGYLFEELAQRYSLDDTSKSGGKLPPIARKFLSNDLREALEAAQAGDVVGPLAIEGRWCLFQLDKIVPAALEGEVQAQLESELFQQWIDEHVSAMTVKMEVTQWLYL